MNLFIDTNIFLNFFHYSKDTLDELEKVFVLHSYGKIKIWITDQVELEFYRNRETKLADALKKFSDEKPNPGIPLIVKDYPEYNQLISALKQVEKSRDQLVQKIREDITAKSLTSDKLINGIFKKSERIAFSEDKFLLAKRRSELRNPPGKNGSLGDAINWEALLANIPNEEDIFLISEDGDFSSPLEPERLSDFLTEEWFTKKKSKAILFKRLSQFLSTMFPEAKVAAELEKDILISELTNSKSFVKTHKAIEKLSHFDGFSPKQASEIVDAYIVNPQVNWIVSDSDVQGFGKKIQESCGSTLDPEQHKAFLSVFL